MTHHFDFENRRSLSQDWDVVIIGAGIAGAASAIICSQLGLKTLLVEKQKFPREKVCGCCLNHRAIQMLDELNVLDRLNERGANPLNRIKFIYGGRSIQIPLRHSFALSRGALDEALVQTAVEHGCVFRDQVTARVVPQRESIETSASNDRNSTMVRRSIELRQVGVDSQLKRTDEIGRTKPSQDAHFPLEHSPTGFLESSNEPIDTNSTRNESETFFVNAAMV
ncbi:MAG: FAD-binding protein, partial [Planctomycetes bacterium]|nr:FAD-binding protein [Planctomycetota bacterium]